MVIYRSPSLSESEFLSFLEDKIEQLVIKEYCIVIGDFNINVMGNSFYAKKIQTIIRGLGMKQYVNKPTRITKDSQTIIDLVLANGEVKVQVKDRPKITDHAWLQVELGSSRSEKKYREFSGRGYSKFNSSEFLGLLELKVVQGQGLCVNTRAEKFIGSIVDTLNIVAPRKIFKIPKVWDGKKWFSDEIRVATTRRDEAYCKAIYTNAEHDWLQFKIERNVVVKLIKVKKKEYYENMINHNKNDPKTMWKTLKEVIRGESMEPKVIDNLDFEVLKSVNECNIANKFNLFYVLSIENIVKSVKEKREADRKSICLIETKDTIENFEMIGARNLEEIIMALPNKKGTEEGITSEILKLAFHVIKDEFVEIINDSLRIGQCPDGWKTSTIIPIPKVGKPRIASEYRPINILPIYEKVLELVVKEQIEAYLENNNIISEHQSGFRKQHSCETAMQVIIDDWKLIIVSEGKMIGVIFMDLK
ncbi:uncharacterized protein LOC112589101 [Harpegnathos saltator]|uniref:uncharacterized protein LOC112589101 n=1 Tax=Harpegnathos saltator TaxID=610380 RepID=UPI000DBEE258|nr:uncharacterized protein LOC112589101 [Harpegnathos saltator]